MSFDLKIKNGDFVIKGGDLQKVQDSEKLIQDILKITLSPVGSNPAYPWYGSYVSRSLIGSGMSTDIIFQMGQSQLQNAIENLKSLQDIQVRSFLNPNISADEHIGAIVDISLNRGIKDPRLFDVLIKVTTKGFKPATASFTITTI